MMMIMMMMMIMIKMMMMMIMMMLMMIDDVDDDVNFTLNLHRIDYIIPCYNTSQHRFDDTLKVVLLSCYIPMKLGNLQCIQRPRRKILVCTRLCTAGCSLLHFWEILFFG